MKGACSCCVWFGIFIPLCSHCWCPSFKVVLAGNELQHRVGSLLQGSAAPPGRITLVPVELSGLGKLQPGWMQEISKASSRLGREERLDRGCCTVIISWHTADFVLGKLRAYLPVQ